MITPSVDTGLAGGPDRFGGLLPGRSDIGSMLSGGLCFLVLGFLLPIYAVPNLQFGDALTAVAAGLVVYSALRLSIILASGEARLLATAFWTFSYTFLSLPLLAQVTEKRYPLLSNFSYDSSTFAAAESLIIVGLVGYEVGRYLSRRKNNSTSTVPRTDRPETGTTTTNISEQRAAVIGYIGLVFVALAVAQHGLPSFFISRDAFTENFLGPAPTGVKFYLDPNKAAGLSLQILAQVPTFIGAYLLLYLRHSRRNDPHFPGPSWWLIAPLVVGNIIINNPIANARFWYGTVVIAFLTIYLPLRTRRNAARLFIFVFIFVSLFSFHQLAAFRRTGAQDFGSVPIRVGLVTDPDYGSPQQIMNGLSYVDQHGHTLGQQLIGTALVWFPRVAWPGKPGDTGQLVGGAAGFKVSSPLWTEGQIDFGPAGTMFFLAVIGALVGRLDNRFMRSGTRTDIFAASAPIMASLLVFFLRGSLQPAFGSLIPVVACIAFCVNFRRPTAASLDSDRHGEVPASASSQEGTALMAPDRPRPRPRP